MNNILQHSHLLFIQIDLDNPRTIKKQQFQKLVQQLPLAPTDPQP